MDTPQNNENTNPQNDGKNTNPKPEDKPSIGLSILSFIFPLIGFILAAVNWKSKPISAKRYLIVSAVSFALFIIINISSKDKNSNQVPQATANADNTQTTANAGKLSLHDAVKNGDVEAVKTLIASGANVNEKIKESSPLDKAVYYNCKIDIVKALIDAGANVNAHNYSEDGKSDYGTPLHTLVGISECPNALEITKILIASGANVNEKDHLKYTPLLKAVDSDNCKVDIVKALIDAGADVNAVEMYGYSPLHLVSQPTFSKCPNHFAIAKTLIASGANVNQKDMGGDTPLHGAAMVNISIVRLLISSGADVNARSNRGRTPIYEHVRYNKSVDPDMIKLLISSGADVNIATNEGKTPLDIAKEQKKEDAITILRQYGAK